MKYKDFDFVFTTHNKDGLCLILLSDIINVLKKYDKKKVSEIIEFFEEELKVVQKGKI